MNKETPEAKEGRSKLPLWILRMVGLLGATQGQTWQTGIGEVHGAF